MFVAAKYTSFQRHRFPINANQLNSLSHTGMSIDATSVHCWPNEFLHRFLLLMNWMGSACEKVDPKGIEIVVLRRSFLQNQVPPPPKREALTVCVGGGGGVVGTI